MHKWRELLHLWRVVVWVCLLPLQPDVFIFSAPVWSARFGVHIALICAGIVVIATAKMGICYWFWRWVSRLIADTERYQRLKALVHEAASMVRAEGLADRFFDEIKLRHQPDVWSEHRVFKAARRAGCVALLGMGVAPVSGARSLCVPFLAATKWHGGLYALALGNALRVVYLTGGIKLILEAIR